MIIFGLLVHLNFSLASMELELGLEIICLTFKTYSSLQTLP